MSLEPVQGQRSAPNVAERFKANALGLIMNFNAINNVAIERGHNYVKREVFAFVEAYVSRMDARDLMWTFAQYSHMYWDEIARRDTNFFDEHAESVFDLSRTANTEFGSVAGKPQNLVLFRQLLTAPDAVTAEDKILFWRYFESMVRITWKAIQEDAREDTERWFPRNLRDTIVSYPGITQAVEEINDRRSR